MEQSKYLYPLWSALCQNISTHSRTPRTCSGSSSCSSSAVWSSLRPQRRQQPCPRECQSCPPGAAGAPGSWPRAPCPPPPPFPAGPDTLHGQVRALIFQALHCFECQGSAPRRCTYVSSMPSLQLHTLDSNQPAADRQLLHQCQCSSSTHPSVTSVWHKDAWGYAAKQLR